MSPVQYNITEQNCSLKLLLHFCSCRSYSRALSIVHTTMEIKRIGHPLYSTTDMDTIRRGYKQAKVTRIVGMCSGLKKEARPQVEVYVALTGTVQLYRFYIKRKDWVWHKP